MTVMGDGTEANDSDQLTPEKTATATNQSGTNRQRLIVISNSSQLQQQQQPITARCNN